MARKKQAPTSPTPIRQKAAPPITPEAVAEGAEVLIEALTTIADLFGFKMSPAVEAAAEIAEIPRGLTVWQINSLEAYLSREIAIAWAVDVRVSIYLRTADYTVSKHHEIEARLNWPAYTGDVTTAIAFATLAEETAKKTATAQVMLAGAVRRWRDPYLSAVMAEVSKRHEEARDRIRTLAR